MVEEIEQETQQDPIPPLPKGFKVVKSGGDLPPLPAGYVQKKKPVGTGLLGGGTVGNSSPQSNVSTNQQADNSNPFAIGGQYNQPPKLDADKLDLSNTKHDAAIAEQVKNAPIKIPITPILDNVIPKPISEIDAKDAIARQQQHKIDMQTAIDNTTSKVLKNKGIDAPKGSPIYEAERKKVEEKTKPTMIGGIVVNGAEATYHKDKNGNIGLDRNLGFLEGIRKGFNDAVNGEDEANAFSNMDTKQKVEYANKQMQEKPPTEYMSERNGVGGLIGGATPYMVKAATAATLATAAGIAAPETGGASLAGVAPVLTVLLTAPDMIKQGQKDEIMTRYMQLKQEQPNTPDEELMKIAEQGEISGGIVGAANALAFTTSLKLPILDESKSVLKSYLNGVASSAVHLGGITAGSKAAQIAERKLEGYNVNTDKAIDEVVTTFTENATAGAILNGLISGVHTLPKAVKSAFKFALKDTPTSEIKTALDANVEAGRIPPEVAQQTVADIDGYKTALAKTADGLKPETQASVAGLIQARDNVAQEMATKDPTQREVYQQKIEAYNKQIEKITKTNEPLKYEIDEVTGNPIDKVAPPKEPTFEDKVRETYPTLKEANDKEVNDFVKENAADDPKQFITKFGQDKFDEIVKDIPTQDLQDKLDMVIKGNSDSPNVDILDKIISDREKSETKGNPEEITKPVELSTDTKPTDVVVDEGVVDKPVIKPTFENVAIETHTPEEVDNAKNEIFNNASQLKVGQVIDGGDNVVKVVTDNSIDSKGNHRVGIVTFERQPDGSLIQRTNQVWVTKNSEGKINVDYNPHETGTNSKGERVTTSDKITDNHIDLSKEKVFIEDADGNLVETKAFESFKPKDAPQSLSTKPEIKNEEAKVTQDTNEPTKTGKEQPMAIEPAPEGKAAEGKKPPIEPTEPIGEEGGKKEGITHAAVEELRKLIELPEYEGKPTETHETLIEEAQKTIKENKNAANEVLDKMENGGKITNKDNAIAAIYKATIDAEMAKNPTPELLKRATRLAKALDVSGTELGKALESRKLVGTEDNLTNFLLDKQAAQGTALTETQVKSEAAKYEELKIAKEALEKQLELEREQHAKDIAEMGVNKAKAKAKRESKKSSEDYKKERKDTVEAARKALKDIRDNPQASAAPIFRELVAIAPHVKEYVNSLVNEGVDKLDNIVTAVHAEFKDVLEGITKRDVLDIMAGDYNGKPKDQTRNEKANTARLLEREAKLLKELERERKGEEKAKSESQKTQSNRRIDELKEKIKEVRRQNKNREVDKESPEDMTAGEIEYNAKLQKSLTEKAQKLTQDIRDKKYLEEEAPKPVFKKSRKTQQLEDKVIDLENKIRHERSKDEYEKRGKFRKAFDKVMEVLGIRRLVQSAVDISVPFRQGATLISPRQIDVWLKSFHANLKSIFSPKKFERIMREIRQDKDYHDMVKDNVVFNDLGSADPNLHNEDFRKSFIYKIPILSEPLKASNRSADAFLNVARYEMYKKLRNNLEKKGLTRESDPKAFRYIGNWVMAMTGRGTMHSALEKPAMNAVLGNTFYGARLMASRFNLLNPVTYLDPRIPKEAKAEAVKDLVGFTTTMLAVGTALSYATGAKISLNPDDSDFLQLRYDKKVYDISGGLANYVRTGARIMKAGYTKATGTKYEGQKATDNAGKSIVNFFRNKLSPNTGFTVDAFFGGRYGNEFSPSDIYQIYPMYAPDVVKAYKEEGIVSLATVLLPNILGVGYGSYASKGQIDTKLDDLLDRNLRSDSMNNEKIFNYNDNGRVITDKEFDEFAKKRDEAIKKDITLLFNNGIGKTEYKDLTPEQVADEIKYIKATATREVKEELFGKHKKTHQEKKETKKLQKEHAEQYKNN